MKGIDTRTLFTDVVKAKSARSPSSLHDGLEDVSFTAPAAHPGGNY